MQAVSYGCILTALISLIVTVSNVSKQKTLEPVHSPKYKYLQPFTDTIDAGTDSVFFCDSSGALFNLTGDTAFVVLTFSASGSVRNK